MRAAATSNPPTLLQTDTSRLSRNGTSDAAETPVCIVHTRTNARTRRTNVHQTRPSDTHVERHTTYVSARYEVSWPN